MTIDNPEFEASYCRVFNTPVVGVIGDDEHAKAFFDHFYDRLLKQEGIDQFFAGIDMNRQKDMLRNSLFELTSCWTLGHPSASLVRIAEAHERFNIDTAILDVWLETLLETVRVMDPDYDETVRLAWMSALGPGMFFMKSFLTNRPKLSDSEKPPWYSGAFDPSA